MRKGLLGVCLLWALLSIKAELSAQGACPEGYGGPRTVIWDMPIPNSIPFRTCRTKVYYCVKEFQQTGITRYAYHYWIEPQCSLTQLSDTDRASFYRSVSLRLAQDNPGEFQYNMCANSPVNNETIIDVSHAACVFELVHNNGGPGDTLNPPTYEYISCPGSGKCYERFEVCTECTNNVCHDVNTGRDYCCPPLPGYPPNPNQVTARMSWTTGDCRNILTPDGIERPCTPVCDGDAPGPDIGAFVGTDENRTLMMTSSMNAPR